MVKTKVGSQSVALFYCGDKDMRRGTTPTHVFTPDIDVSEATVMYITYQQNNETVLEKTIEDVTFNEDGTFSVTLTQAETLAFEEMARVEIQIRVKFPDGSAVGSEIVRSNADRILKDGEI